jgi:general secretion pathway protein C
MGDVRVGPDGSPGKVLGMKLTHLRPGSVLGLVGLKEGDRLDAINGIDLTSPEAGLEAYAKLRLAPHIVLKVTRDARPMEVQYDVK